jgi:hypothetical protein
LIDEESIYSFGYHDSDSMGRQAALVKLDMGLEKQWAYGYGTKFTDYFYDGFTYEGKVYGVGIESVGYRDADDGSERHIFGNAYVVGWDKYTGMSTNSYSFGNAKNQSRFSCALRIGDYVYCGGYKDNELADQLGKGWWVKFRISDIP